MAEAMLGCWLVAVAELISFVLEHGDGLGHGGCIQRVMSLLENSRSRFPSAPVLSCFANPAEQVLLQKYSKHQGSSLESEISDILALRILLISYYRLKSQSS